MEPVFRFALVRPPVKESKSRFAIDLSQGTRLQVDLTAATRQADSKRALKNAYKAFLANPAFIGNPASNVFNGQLSTFAAALSKLEGTLNVDEDAAAQVGQAIQRAFSKSAQEVVNDLDFLQVLANLRDSILTIKGTPEEHTRDIEGLARQLRDMDVILTLGKGELAAKGGTELSLLRNRNMLLPRPAIATSFISDRDFWVKEIAEQAERIKGLKENLKLVDSEYQDLVHASNAIMKIPPKYLAGTRPEALPALTPSEGEMHSAMLGRNAGYRWNLADLNIAQIKSTFPSTGPRAQGATETESREVPTASDLSAAASAVTLAEKLLPSSAIQGAVGFPAFKPKTIIPLTMKPEVKENLSQTTSKVLNSSGHDLTQTSLQTVALDFLQQRKAKSTELRSLAAQLQPIQTTVLRVGSTIIKAQRGIRSQLRPQVSNLSAARLSPDVPDYVGYPQTHGNISAAGVSQLLIVKQQLIRYEGGDIAHIENVLKNEQKQREHMSKTKTEQTTTTETEFTSTQEKSFDSTNRYELANETNKQIKEDQAFKIGATVNAYGPSVTASASVDYSTSSHREATTKTAVQFAQEKTQKAAETIAQRTMSRMTTTTISEVEDKNMFQFNNIGSTGHISGVYQWVNKVYECQMYDYGARMMYDIMIPEPAAFLMYNMDQDYASKMDLVQPPAFDLTADSIVEEDWDDLAKTYGVPDMEPPLEPIKTFSHAFKASMTPPTGAVPYLSDSAEIDVPDGYEPYDSDIRYSVMSTSKSWGLAVHAGDGSYIVSEATTVFPDTFDQFGIKTGKVKVSFHSHSVASCVVHIVIFCKPSAAGLQAWRQRVWTKVNNAHKAAVTDFENKLAELQIQAGVTFQGQNPEINLRTMRTELKRSVISTFTEQHFRSFGAINYPETGFASDFEPSIDFERAKKQGYYASFFEQAFEWENMTWSTYPYYWATRSTWGKRLAFNDPDPLFDDFLKAGFARAQVPARLGFEGAIDHFVKTGEPWGGGALPTISDELYVPVSTEVAERLKRPGTEEATGPSWEVKLPTSLVRLRPDDKLPTWTFDKEKKVWREDVPVVPI